jgi:hypothetical protein
MKPLFVSWHGALALRSEGRDIVTAQVRNQVLSQWLDWKRAQGLVLHSRHGEGPVGYFQSRIERFWNAFGLLVCLAAAADVAYWRRNRWEGLLFGLLMILAGVLFARLVGVGSPTGNSSRDSSDKGV